MENLLIMISNPLVFPRLNELQVDLYFRGQVVLSNMYRLMEENNRATAQEAIDAVKDGTNF